MRVGHCLAHRGVANLTRSMATYAIGDIQGCYDPLQRLLEVMAFDPARDRLWLAGDLVNRGPDSASVLRWARSLGDRAVTIFGNHDLHLLGVAFGARPHKGRDTLRQVLDAPDASELLEWLRHQRLMHVEAGWAMVHAGLWPSWTIEQALALAHEVESELRGPNYRDLLTRACTATSPRSGTSGSRGFCATASPSTR